LAPRATQAVRVTVQSSVVEGPATGYYTYTYQVLNEHNSSATVPTFGIAPVPRPDSVETPDQWLAFYGYEDHDSALVWSCIDTLSATPAGWDTLNQYPSSYDIQINETKVFGLVSRSSPTPTPSINFYAQGFAPLPDAEEFTVNGAAPFPTLFDSGVTGLAYGPAAGTIVGVAPSSSNPSSRMALPRPNPAGSLCSVAFSLAADASVQLRVFDLHGRLIRTLVSGPRPRGLHTVTWDLTGQSGQRVAAGVYFARLELSGKVVDKRKIVVTR
jgi:FlgD Ig-like domain